MLDHKEKMAALREIFPEAFEANVLNPTALADALGLVDGLGVSEQPKSQRYELTWPGKYQVRAELRTPSANTLAPNRAQSLRFDEARHCFVTGENLEVLKLLQKPYFGKIKAIYIDPPYNTGKDSFVYPDSFAEKKADYLRRSGQTDSEGNMLSSDVWRKNTVENGHFHSVWLSMMYARLLVARTLLRENGVIFISIDDNEMANLRLLCDEVFGQENFVCTFVWQKTFAPKNDAKYVSSSHEYILCFAKNLRFFERKLLPRTEESNAAYSNPDEDPRGIWTSTSMLATTFSEKYVFPILGPKGDAFSPPAGRCWRYSKEKIEELIRDNRIWFGQSGKNVPRTKRFLTEVQQGIVPQTLLLYKEVGSGQDATNQLKKLFDNTQLFDFPKPVALVKHLLSLATEADDLVLDFFAGSGTTAQAVLELNQSDGGRRRFICVQMPEPLEEGSEGWKLGFRNIADMSIERVRRVLNTDSSLVPGGLACFSLTSSALSRMYGTETSFDFPLFASDSEAIFAELRLRGGIELDKPYRFADDFFQSEAIWFCGSFYKNDHLDLILAQKPLKVAYMEAAFTEDADVFNLTKNLEMAQIELVLI